MRCTIYCAQEHVSILKELSALLGGMKKSFVFVMTQFSFCVKTHINDTKKCVLRGRDEYEFMKYSLNWKDEHNWIPASLIETLSPSSLINLSSERDLNWPIQPQGIQVASLLQQTDMSLQSRCDHGPNFFIRRYYQVTLASERIWNYPSSAVNKHAAELPSSFQQTPRRI